MCKMGSHDPCEHSTHKLWPKERLRVKLAIWFLTTKSQESPRFPCVQVACDISLKSSQQGLQLCFGLDLNRRFAHKVMGPKVAEVPTMGKWHLCARPMARLKVVPFKNDLVFWLISGLLFIFAKMNQGFAQNPFVYISMVLLAQTFRSNGWTTRPTWLHKHVMVLCQVPNKEPCGRKCGRTTNHLACPSWTLLCPWKV
jgi:hypothetical protein